MMALWLGVPVFGIIAILAAAALWVGAQSAARIDAVSSSLEAKLAKTAFLSASDPIVRSAQDYSFWDETYDQTNGSIDLKWAEENLGPYLVKTYSATHVFVIDRMGRIGYATVPGADGHAQLKAGQDGDIVFFGEEPILNVAASALYAPDGEDFAQMQGFIVYKGLPAFVAARPIRPDNPERQGKAPSKNALVLVRTFGDADVKSLSAAFGLPGLTVSAEGPVALNAPPGQTSAVKVNWTHREIGGQFIDELGRVLLPVSVAALLLLAVTGVGWYRAFSAVRDAELQALEERAKSVQDTARAKSLFVANMSHELRTPLNAIIGFSEVIKSEMLGKVSVPKYIEYAGDIYASGKHLLGIVNNILTLSKIEAQQQRVQIEDVDAADASSEALRMTAPIAAKRGIRIETEFEDGPVARADRQALTQIAVNLLSNAIKFSEPNGLVRFRISMADGAVVMTVADSGCGIPPETLTQLGRPFTQAEDPYRRNYQGSGLGLSICFALARAMDGELTIQSEVDKGTLAQLTLPAAGRGQSAPDAKPEPRAA